MTRDSPFIETRRSKDRQDYRPVEIETRRSKDRSDYGQGELRKLPTQTNNNEYYRRTYRNREDIDRKPERDGQIKSITGRGYEDTMRIYYETAEEARARSRDRDRERDRDTEEARLRERDLERDRVAKEARLRERDRERDRDRIRDSKRH